MISQKKSLSRSKSILDYLYVLSIVLDYSIWLAYITSAVVGRILRQPLRPSLYYTCPIKSTHFKLWVNGHTFQYDRIVTPLISLHYMAKVMRHNRFSNSLTPTGYTTTQIDSETNYLELVQLRAQSQKTTTSEPGEGGVLRQPTLLWFRPGDYESGVPTNTP